jgi:DHA1 family multidrug resistance protein-like MFS transporter
MLLDLSIALAAVYTAIIYGIFYSFFENYLVEQSMRAHELGGPERRLIPTLYVTLLVPIGLLIFGWMSKPDIHWIVSVIGIFLIIQSISLYLPLSDPQYVALLFAGNGLGGSALAARSVCFSYPMFHNLGVDREITLLVGPTPDAALDRGVELKRLSLFEHAHAPGVSIMRCSKREVCRDGTRLLTGYA